MKSVCEHENFDAFVEVNRIIDTGRYTADVRIKCLDCGKPMRFLGLPMGLDMNGAAVSADGTKGRFAIHPVNEPVPGMSDDGPAGFRVLPHREEPPQSGACQHRPGPFDPSRRGWPCEKCGYVITERDAHAKARRPGTP